MDPGCEDSEVLFVEQECYWGHETKTENDLDVRLREIRRAWNGIVEAGLGYSAVVHRSRGSSEGIYQRVVRWLGGWNCIPSEVMVVNTLMKLWAHRTPYNHVHRDLHE